MLQNEQIESIERSLFPLNQTERAGLFSTYVIIGSKVSFTTFEREKIQKSFSQFFYLEAEKFTESEIIWCLEKLRHNHRDLTLVFNLNQPNSSILNYFSKSEYRNIKFQTYDKFVESFFSKVFLPTHDCHLEHLQNIQALTPLQYGLKRFMDYSIALILAVCSWPIFIYVALRIKYESPGPIFFKQTRIGLGGRPFKCYKFRSMNLHGPFNLYTQKSDSRIFPFGDFMRKARLDELPQIWNILRGEMHLIGPRPEWNLLVEEYEQVIPHYHQRHLIRPGISGWAQVNYGYGECSEDARQKLMYDLYYLKYWSFSREITIFFRTIWVVLLRLGH